MARLLCDRTYRSRAHWGEVIVGAHYTYSVGYDRASPITMGGGSTNREATIAKAMESLAYYAQPDVRAERGPAVGEITLHCATCDGNGNIVVGGARERKKPYWARKTRTCETCHGTGAVLSEPIG